MSEFGERLAELMFEKNLNRKELAQELKMSATCVTHYLQGKRLPTVESLIKIADYFQCSTDFLLGREEENRTLSFKPCPPFSEQIEFLKNNCFQSAYELYHKTDVSKSCYYDWKSGNRQPSLDNVIRLADQCERRIDFILGRES